MKANIIMEWVIRNWFLVVALTACIVALIWVVFRFFALPTEEQKAKVKEWLIWACIEAEKKLQSDTGKLKLREVYDKFCAVPAFKWVAIVISFKQFEEWVSDALLEAKKMLVSNEALAEYVYGKYHAENEVEKLKEQIGG